MLLASQKEELLNTIDLVHKCQFSVVPHQLTNDML